MDNLPKLGPEISDEEKQEYIFQLGSSMCKRMAQQMRIDLYRIMEEAQIESEKNGENHDSTLV